MKNRIALITGGMGGIGTAICQHFSNEGAKVVVAYRREQAVAEEWLEKQKAQGYKFDICYLDVTDFEVCRKSLNDIEAKLGRIDILVNNAGITQDGKFHKMQPEQWGQVLQTNLDSLFNVTYHIIQGMLKRAYGRIVNISSINGQKGQFGQANYAAAKAGVHGFTKSLSQEVADKGITVNTLSPGYVNTQMMKSIPDKTLKKIIDQIPVGRLGQPEEVARAVAFLASEKSSFITGTNMMINGGQYLL
jgi:acetoacetyl-CoA reductase